MKALSGPNGSILGDTYIAGGKGPNALVLDGKDDSVMITDKSSQAGLPERDITVEAWVMVEQPLKWGGIIGAVRDNGSDETGWVLGYRESKFTFAIATVDKPRLTYLPSQTEFEPGRWYHVVGTYDGQEHRVHVNGQLEAADKSRKGKLLYPPTDTFYEIGAYHDTNEYFHMTGLIHEVAVYKHALTADQVAARYEGKKGKFPEKQFRPEPYRPPLGPYAYYDSSRSAVVCWETESHCPTVLEIGTDGTLDRRVSDPKPKTAHRVTVDGLKRDTEYTYRVAGADQAGAPGIKYAIDTTFNYMPLPVDEFPKPYAENATSALYKRAAKRIISETGVTKGYCLVYGFGRGRLAYELAKHSDLIIFGFDEDASRVAEARSLLRKAKVYGNRITVRHVSSLARLPVPRCFANLVVSEQMIAERTCPGSAGEVLRVLRPCGGVAYLGRPASGSGVLPPNPPAAGGSAPRKRQATSPGGRSPQRPRGARAEPSHQKLQAWPRSSGASYELTRGDGVLWAKMTRGPLPGAGRWTHQYAEPGNSAFGGETLSGASKTSDLAVQWLGRPGPDFGIDRNPRMPAPLSVNGRLFHQGLNRIIAVDAYNGAFLWLLAIPDLRRVNMPRDASNWCADGERLYVAVRDRCWLVDAHTGRLRLTCPLPDEARRETHEWGYIARAGDKLYGSSVKKGSAYTDFWGTGSWYDKPSGPGSYKVCSDDLFACSADTGRPVWRHQEGMIINTTVAIGGGRVYFVESRHPEAKASATGRVSTDKLWLDQYLVALDADTGEKAWEQPIDTADGTVVFYLVYAGETLAIMSSTDGKYHLNTYEAGSGKARWQAAHDWTRTHHSGHMQHPAVIGNVVYQEPRGYDLRTGKLLTDKLGRHAGCATYAGTKGALIYRGDGGRIGMWDAKSETVSIWSKVRPSCWLSVIPAGGMVLAPEGGGGCSCGNWMETSLGFLPKQTEGGLR